MKAVFVDTMGWYSLFDRRDAWHDRAAALMRTMARKKTTLITTDYVVDETATLLLARGAKVSLTAFFEMIEQSQALALAMVGPSRFKEASMFFQKHRDQGYSFTDVTSFLVMWELKITSAFTHDAHFTRAGFERLLE